MSQRPPTIPRGVFAVAPLAVALALSVGGGAGARSGTVRVVDLRVKGAVEIGGAGAVADDGLMYLLLGDETATPEGRDAAGAVFAVASTRGKVDVRAGAFEGFAVIGAAAGDGVSSACAADVDGDGIDDLVVGAEGADTSNGADSGAAYVVFGGDGAGDVDLADLQGDSQEARGFQILGASASDRAGEDVACVEDVDGDGQEDFVVAAPAAGASYVVFGKEDSGDVDLARFHLNAQGAMGFRIDTQTVLRRGAYAVAGGGDTNGDGRPDVLVGVVRRPDEWTGVVHVVFGKADPVPVDATGPDAAAGGYTIHGQGRGWMTGAAVASAGDVNDDGLTDILIGANRSGSYRRAGRAYVVFGAREPDDVVLGELGERGFKMVGGPGRDAAGSSVAAAGDVNGDGLADVVVGAPLARHRGRRGAGVVYVVFGSRSSRAVALRHLDGRGFVVMFGGERSRVGGSVGSYRLGGNTRLVAASRPLSTTYAVDGP